MNLLALLLYGFPPWGRGIYIRNNPAVKEQARARFACVSTLRGDMAEQVDAVGSAWLYSTPGKWTPIAWRDELARMLALAESLGSSVEGIIADPEGEWGGATNAQAEELGRGLAEASSSVRVGCTTYPLFRRREALTAAAGDGVWFSPQIYGRTSQDPARWRAWYDEWARLVGESRLCPSIAAWPVSPLHSTAEGYASYLAELPSFAGAIAWPEPGDLPIHIRGPLRVYEPGGSGPGTVALAARNALFRPAGLALVGGILALVAVVFIVAAMARAA
ncbi:MAG: hypothetical protein IIA54_00465 [Chloroflexi bacterium]|nr:hypothetical protein [Chloroflexota bacterium]